jgi:hypothetical protein
MHAYYLAHKEHIKEMVRKWRAANPEWCRRWSREYAARRRKQRLA